MSLAQRVIIVTGGGSGIGRGIAELLAKDGARVVIAEIDPSCGTRVADEIKRAGGEALFIETDVSREDSVCGMVEMTLSQWGEVYGLINNAGIVKESDLSTLASEDWDLIQSVNLRSVFLCTRAVLPPMRKKAEGSIVNISSVHGLFGFAGNAAYDASKGGMISLTRTIALENGAYQIRANVICPGYIDTPMWDEWLTTLPDPEKMDRETKEWHPLKRRGTPMDVAKAVRFLLSDDSEWITGTCLIVDGGLGIRYYGY